MLIYLFTVPSLGQVAEFDFTNMIFKFGPREKLLSPLQVRSFLVMSTSILQHNVLFVFIP